MSEPLTTLEELLATAHGLAIAATTVTEKVEERLLDAALREELELMRQEARRTRAWCLELEERHGPERARDLLHRANVADEKSSDLLADWFKAGTSPIEAVTFLAMGEAAEVATWTALAQLAPADGDDALIELVDWALPVQQRHLGFALGAAATLGALADPAGVRWG